MHKKNRTTKYTLFLDGFYGEPHPLQKCYVENEEEERGRERVRRDSVCLADRAENFFIINFLPLPFPRKLFSPFSSLQFNGGRRNTEISGRTLPPSLI